MLKKIIGTFKASHFLRSSSLVFFVNIITAFFNYAIIIFVSNALQSDYSLWTALNSLITILLAPFTGLMAEFVKRSSSLAKSNPSHSFQYYNFLRKKVRILSIVGCLGSPLLALVLSLTVSSSNLFVLGFVVIYVALQIYTGLNNQFLLGLLSIKNFALSTITISFSRLIFTLSLVSLGASVFALPIGFILSSLTGYILTEFLIRRVAKKSELVQPEGGKMESEKISFSLKKELFGTVKTMIFLTFLSFFLNISPIVAQNNLGETDKDLLAILFNFGQIIHFGAIAFLGALVAHAARGKNLKIYFSAISVVSGLTLFIGVLFWLFGPLLLALFGRSQYQFALPLILWYALFIAFYNVIYVSTQYLVAQNEYRALITLPIFTFLLTCTLIIASLPGSAPIFSSSVIESFIAASIIIAALAACTLAVQVWRTRKTHAN